MGCLRYEGRDVDISGYEAIEVQLCLRGLGYQGSVAPDERSTGFGA